MALPNVKEFSPKQIRLMNHAETDYTLCASGGATRAGKTFPNLLGFALAVARNSDGFDSAITGHSVELVMRNVGFDLLKLYKSLRIRARLSRDFGTRIIVSLPGGDVSIWIITAHDEKSQNRIQGATLKFLLVEEATRIPKSLWEFLWTRLSAPNSKAWTSHNPENPAHWWQKEVIDKIGDYNGQFVHFTLGDNPGLDEAYKERIKRSLKGAAYTRLVLGLPAATSGVIYPDWLEIEEPLETGKINFGFDYGRSGVMAMLSVKRDGVMGDVLGEWAHDSRKDGVLTDAEYIEAIEAFVDQFGNNRKAFTVYADPATPRHFKALLKKTGMMIRDARNDLIEGITVTAASLANGELRIGDCPELQTEMYNYVWDAKQSDLGIDMPVRVENHRVDCLRYENFSAHRQPIGKLLTVREVGF